MADRRRPTGWRAWSLVSAAVVIFAVLVLLPLAIVFREALASGIPALWSRLTQPHTVHAMVLTVKVLALAVPLNVVFGLAAAWLLTHYRFMGRGALLTLLDVPLTVSTVVAGLMLVTLFGARGWFGPWLAAHDIRIMHSYPALVLVTVFVTSPIVARELMASLRARGTDQELAALTLGAGRFATWWRVTLPGIRHALAAGVMLCVARAAGEYGGVAVVSGNVRGRTQTMSLQVDSLYNDYDFVGAFGVAAVMATVSLTALACIHWQERRQQLSSSSSPLRAAGASTTDENEAKE